MNKYSTNNERKVRIERYNWDIDEIKAGRMPNIKCWKNYRKSQYKVVGLISDRLVIGTLEENFHEWYNRMFPILPFEYIDKKSFREFFIYANKLI